MKKKILLTLSLAFIFVCVFVISVSAVEIGGISYTLKAGEDGAENTASINSHKGKTLSVTEIYIPEYVEYEGEKYYVTSLASTAFESTNITRVVFDKNSRVTVIPQWAFKGCSKLTYMELHDGITTISSDAFNGCSQMKLAGGALPTSLTSLAGSSFTNCKAHGITTLVVPEGVTEFVNDTGLQHAGTIKTIVFLGKMTRVSFQYYGGLTVYFAQNSINDLNGNYLNSFMENGRPYYMVTPVEKYDGNSYYTKTDGSLTIAVFSGDNNNSSGGAKTDADGNKVAPANVNQDKYYFCNSDKVAYVIRNNNIAGNWSSYFAVYDAVVGDTTYKLDPHLSGTGAFEEGSCYVTYRCIACNIITKEEISKDAPGHTIGAVTEINFVNGYFENAMAKGTCSKCGVECERSSAPIFESLGYSCATFGDAKGIVQGYKINKEEIAKYNSANGELEIGFVAAVNQTEGDIVPDFASSNVITSEVSLVNDYIETCVKGISDETADAKIVICLFVKAGEKICFLDNGLTLESVSGISYNTVLEQGK